MLILFFIVLHLISCEQKEAWEIEVYQKVADFVEGLETTNIDLNQFDKSKLPPIKIIQPTRNGDNFVILPRDVIEFEGNYYILDYSQSLILKMNINGEVLDVFELQGRGPGELIRPTDIATNGEYIFVYDSGNSRLHQYDRNFEPVKTIVASSPTFDRGISSADSVLFILDNSDPDRENFLLSRYHIYPELNKESSMIDRILPIYVQPMVVNSIEFYSNSKGSLVFGYTSLPKVFVVNEFNDLTSYITFSGKEVEKVDSLNIANINRARSDMNSETIGLAPFIYDVVIDEKNNIFLLTIDKTLVALTLNEIGEYELAGTYNTEHPSGVGMRPRLSLTDKHLLLIYENHESILLYDIDKQLIN